MSACRLCWGTGMHRLTLTPTPIANSFPEHPDADAMRYPLVLQECELCGHIQLRDQVQLEWDHYHYVTPSAVHPHLAEAAQGLRRRYPNAQTVLEIGSNNGANLAVLRAEGFRALGVDPSAREGIRLPFSSDLAKMLDRVDLVVANNVLAHVDDLLDVLLGIRLVLNWGGALVFEVQYLPKMMELVAFDMIYHEHRDYHTLGPLVPFLNLHDLVITDYELIPTHGGSVRVYCGHKGYEPACLLPDERLDWRTFSRYIQERAAALHWQIRAVDGPVAAFGATAKSTTLLHQCELTDRIAYCVDETPGKQGRYIPGTNIPIVPLSRLEEDPPAAVLLTAWNYADHIKARFPHLNWIVPFVKEVPV